MRMTPTDIITGLEKVRELVDEAQDCCGCPASKEALALLPNIIEAVRGMQACMDEYEALETENHELESENEILVKRIAKLEGIPKPPAAGSDCDLNKVMEEV